MDNPLPINIDQNLIQNLYQLINERETTLEKSFKTVKKTYRSDWSDIVDHRRHQNCQNV